MSLSALEDLRNSGVQATQWEPPAEMKVLANVAPEVDAAAAETAREALQRSTAADVALQRQQEAEQSPLYTASQISTTHPVHCSEQFEQFVENIPLHGIEEMNPPTSGSAVTVIDAQLSQLNHQALEEKIAEVHRLQKALETVGHEKEQLQRSLEMLRVKLAALEEERQNLGSCHSNNTVPS